MIIGTQGGRKRKSAAKTKEEKFAEKEKEEDLSGIGYFTEPMLVESLWSAEEGKPKIHAKACFAKGNYSYVLETTDVTNQLYSWGMGENYVLGSRDDDNQFLPYKVHPKMFEELPVL
jgi:hypothetical protein